MYKTLKASLKILNLELKKKMKKLSNKYFISGDMTGKTYGIYEVKQGEVLPPIDREPVVNGLETIKACKKWIAEKEKKNG